MKKYSAIYAFLFLISCSINNNALPDSISGFTLNKKLEGADAKTLVDHLHFENVSSDKNEIGFYSDGKSNALIYITYYADNVAATSAEKKMTDKISPLNSVFAGGKYVQIDGSDVYICFGMGQAHYVFSHNNMLFWISVDSIRSSDFIKDYLKYIQK